MLIQTIVTNIAFTVPLVMAIRVKNVDIIYIYTMVRVLKHVQMNTKKQYKM